MCLEPPLLANELPEEDEWFCKECEAAQQVSLGPANALPIAHMLRNLSAIEAERPTSQGSMGGSC